MPATTRSGTPTAPGPDAYLRRAAVQVVAVDRRGTVTWAGRPVASLRGLRPLTVGGSVLDVIHPDDRALVALALDRVTARPGVHEPIRCRVLDDAGAAHWIDCRADNALDDPAVGAVVLTVRPVDAERRTEAALEASEWHLRTVLDSFPVNLLTYDRDKRVTFFGGSLGSLRYPAAEIVGRLLSDLITDPRELAQADRVLAGETVSVELEMPENRVVEIRATPIVVDGEVTGAAVVTSDVSARHRAHAQLVASEERFRSLVQRSSDIALIYGPDLRLQYVSPSVRLFGYDAEVLTGANLVDYCHPEDAEAALATFRQLVPEPGATVTVELRLRDAYGHYRWVEQVLANHLGDPAVSGIVGNLRDVTERKRAEQNLDRLALTDELTGLPNRSGFANHLREVIDRSQETGGRVTVVFLDVDEFKLVNDSLGHACGDEMLRAVAGRLRSRVRDGDLVARFGGDEFVVLVEGGDESLPVQVAERMASAFEAPFEIDGGTFFASASIGVASTPPYEAADLLRNADAAMYRAKALGRARIEFFDAQLAQNAAAVLQMRSELRRAIDEEEFILHFQPIMDLASRRIDGMEALVRWQHPERGMVPPLDFITAAEDSGLIVELGAWVLRRSCLEAATWPRDMHVAVNLSVRQLADRAIVAVVADALAESGLDPGRLVLEVTESALMANAEMAVGCLQDLKALGVRLAIDDFGTGYSSLVYLKRMPVDAIKVDRSFVDGLGDDAEDTAIVSSVVRLAHAVGVQAIAEGVETAEQQAHLRDLGCDLAQGFLWSRPVPAAELRVLLARDELHAFTEA